MSQDHTRLPPTRGEGQGQRDKDYAQAVLRPLAFRLTGRADAGENVAIGQGLRREIEAALTTAAALLDSSTAPASAALKDRLADACCEARNSYVSDERGGPDPDEHWAKIILREIPDLFAPSCAPIVQRTVYCTASPERMANMLVEAADALTPWMLDETSEFPLLNCALPAILREEAERIRDRLSHPPGGNSHEG